MRRPICCFRCLLAALGFGLWTAPAGAIGTTAPSWKPRETVTSTLANYINMVGADRSLAYDHHGNPGIAFSDVADDLRYARRVPGVGWVHAAVDTVGVVGLYPSLAYDRYERPAISYYDDTNDDLKYARLNGSAWQTETIDMTGNVGFLTSLAFDLLGRPAIAYFDLTNTSLKFVQDSDGDFSLVDETPVTVVNQFGEGWYASLVFDPWNRPMIAHFDSTNNDLRFSVQEPGIGWVTTTVDSTGSTGWYPSIAIDPDTGFPAIAYYDSTNTNLRYAAWDGDAWNPTTVDATGDVGEFPSMAFDPVDGNPAIAYHYASSADLKLAWHDGSTWQTQPVDAVGNVGLTPSLAFNDYGSGFPSIAYFNNIVPGSLFFIEDPPGASVPEPATLFLVAWAAIVRCVGGRRRGARPPCAQHSVLTALNRGRALLLPNFLPNDTRVMRRRICFRWSLAALGFVLWTAPAGAIGITPPSWKPREMVTSSSDWADSVGADRSLAYDHHGNPGIVFFDGSDLRYARRVPGVGWVHAATDAVGNVGSYPSLAYDRYERPAISYYDTSNGDLKYARLNGSAWQIESVDMTGNVGQNTSLAFDLLGRPAIAYYDVTNTSLKYVQDSDGDFSFVDETPVSVVNQFDEGRYASLVFDPWNRPMIAHSDITNADLRFSVQEPGIGWVTTTVDSTGSTGLYPSIAIDPDTGFPAIAYHDATATALRYADWNGDAWNRTSLDQGGIVGEYPSLAFDPADGNPAIAYTDSTNGDLKMAWQSGIGWQFPPVDAVGLVGWLPSLAFNDYGSGFPSIAYFSRGVGGFGELFFIDDPPGAAVPEPASVMLLAIGMALGIGWRERLKSDA